MSYEGLLAILKDERKLAEAERNKPIIECPLCGEPLDVRGEIRNCPWGHYTTTRATKGDEL